jgi:hypothetical protein
MKLGRWSTHIGSLLVIAFGFLSLLGGINAVSQGNVVGVGGTIWGPALMLQGLAYRSAKKRKLGEVNKGRVRQAIELSLVSVSLGMMLLLNDLKFYLATDPFPFVVIFIGLIAYCYVSFSKKIRNNHNDIS